MVDGEPLLGKVALDGISHRRAVSCPNITTSLNSTKKLYRKEEEAREGDNWKN